MTTAYTKDLTPPMVLLFVLTLIYRDVAPFWFYLVTLIAGIALLAR